MTIPTLWLILPLAFFASMAYVWLVHIAIGWLHARVERWLFLRMAKARYLAAVKEGGGRICVLPDSDPTPRP